MTTQAISSDLFGSILPQIRQYEATTGRKISSEAMRAMLEGSFQAADANANQSQQLALQQESLDFQKSQAKKDLAAQKSAATVSGITQIGGTALQGGMMYKSFFPKTLSAVSTGGESAVGTSSALAGGESALGTSATSTASTFGSGVSSALSTVGSYATPGMVGFGVGSLVGNRMFAGKSKGVRQRAGALSGAASGALAGTFTLGPGFGTVIGGLIGGISGAVGGGKK